MDNFATGYLIYSNRAFKPGHGGCRLVPVPGDFLLDAADVLVAGAGREKISQPPLFLQFCINFPLQFLLSTGVFRSQFELFFLLASFAHILQPLFFLQTLALDFRQVRSGRQPLPLILFSA